MSDDWLEIEPAKTTPSTPTGSPAAVPVDFAARVALADECWARLEPNQRAFLTTWRECGFNARAASRKLLGFDNTNGAHTRWQNQNPDYATVMRVWRAMKADAAQDRDRLLARQDAIVEDLLTPKPVLHQGIPVLDTRFGVPEGTVLEEVEAGAASKANEVLLKAAGLLKDREIEVNVGIAVGPPTLNIQVLPKLADKTAKQESVAIDAKFTEVPNEEWLEP